MLKQLFEELKKVYACKDAFLRISEQGNLGTEAVAIIRNANLTTFVTSCFGSGEVGFYHLNEYFLDTFVNDGSRLLKQQAGLFLDLKTQAYISAMSTRERPKEVVLDEMFPESLEEKLIDRRAGAKSLAPSEDEFIERLRNRRKALENGADTEAVLEAQRDNYKWDTFLSDLATYINKNFEAITDEAVTSLKPVSDSKLVNGYVNQIQAASRPAASSSASPPPVGENTPKLSQVPAPPPPPHYHFPPGPPPVRIDHPAVPPHELLNHAAAIDVHTISGPHQQMQHFQQTTQQFGNGGPMNQHGLAMPIFNGAPPYHGPPGHPGHPMHPEPPGPPNHQGPPGPPHNLPPPGFPGPSFHHGPPLSPMRHDHPPPHSGFPLPTGHVPQRMETPFIQHHFPHQIILVNRV